MSKEKTSKYYSSHKRFGIDLRTTDIQTTVFFYTNYLNFVLDRKYSNDTMPVTLKHESFELTFFPSDNINGYFKHESIRIYTRGLKKLYNFIKDKVTVVKKLGENDIDNFVITDNNGYRIIFCKYRN